MEVTQDNMFKLKDMKAARLWMLPPAAMEVATELFGRTSWHTPSGLIFLWCHVL